MLQAVGVGARRSLPAAAGLTWVLKDGLGRLGRLSYTSLRGRTFDCHLKVGVDADHQCLGFQFGKGLGVENRPIQSLLGFASSRK